MHTNLHICPNTKHENYTPENKIKKNVNKFHFVDFASEKENFAVVHSTVLNLDPEVTKPFQGGTETAKGR